MKKIIFFVLLFFLLIFSCFSPPYSKARIGVGVGTGQIVVDQKLKSGMVYQLPSIAVINTGDEESDYVLDISYNQKQSEFQPPNNWFSFKPDQFHLKPGAVQNVDTTLSLPLKTVPGNYFAYVEAHPIQKGQNGSTSISIAAASKLYFTIAPSGLVQGVYYKAVSFWTRYTPWTNIIASLIATFILMLLFKSFFNFNIQIKKKKSE